MVAAGDELARRSGTSDLVWDQQVEAARLTNGYQIQSGRFMSVYLGLMAIVIFFTIICFIVGCLWLCCCNPFVPEKDGIVTTTGNNQKKNTPRNENGEASDEEVLMSNTKGQSHGMGQMISNNGLGLKKK